MIEAPKRLKTIRRLEAVTLSTALGAGLGGLVREDYPFAGIHTPSSGDTLSSALFLTTLISSSIYLGASILRRRSENQPIGTARWLALGVIGALDVYVTGNALGVVR